MPPPRVPDDLARRLYSQAKAERWALAPARLASALEASANRAFTGAPPSADQLERYLQSLHLEDLALACACAEGHEAAWEHFVREQRPLLYRSADSLDPAGEARDLADSLYADLYGWQSPEGGRQSLLRHFHGRSRLATWLRAVLAQRHVDRLRTGRRVEPLPDDASPAAMASPARTPDLDRPRYVELIHRALKRALSRLEARDRLRLGWYYAQGLTLAQIGRLLHEHEATASRQLARTRRVVREEVERQLRVDERLSEEQIADCFSAVAEDAGPLDLQELLAGVERKESSPGRSI